MHNCPFLQENEGSSNNPFRQDLFSYIRLLHASPDAPSVDVYVNDKPVARGLSYKHFTPYLKLPTGLYNVTVYPAGKTTNPVIKTQFQVPNRSIFTIAAIGMLKDISLQPILEPIEQLKPGTSLIRFIHLSPNSPAVDISLINGKGLFKDVNYKEVTPYIPTSPGVYGFQVKQSGTENLVLTVPNIRLLPNKIYSVYIVGLLNGKPPLQVLIPLDGNTYLKF
jgi:hypothetical protein